MRRESLPKIGRRRAELHPRNRIASFLEPVMNCFTTLLFRRLCSNRAKIHQGAVLPDGSRVQSKGITRSRVCHRVLRSANVHLSRCSHDHSMHPVVLSSTQRRIQHRKQWYSRWERHERLLGTCSRSCLSRGLTTPMFISCPLLLAQVCAVFPEVPNTL